MFRETLAQIKLISYLSPVPLRAERAMLYRLFCNVKLCKKNIARKLIDSLYKQRIGTREVEICVSRMYRNMKDTGGRKQKRAIESKSEQ